MDPDPAVLLGPLIEALERHKSKLDRSRIRSAFDLAVKAHGPQLRLSGEPYVTHCVAVAVILVELLGSRADETILISAILHDVVEDTDQDLATLERLFGVEVASLVDGVTKISGLHFDRPEWEQAENFRKMLLSMARDLRVILIKLADRLHNMRTLQSLDATRSTRIARETREIYAPLAHRLGIARIKWELEDLCLKHLDPETYQDLRQKVALKREERQRMIEEVMGPVKAGLTELGIKTEVSGRPKHLDSIYRKMQAQGRKFEEIFDLLGVRVIMRDKADCYRALGVIHDLYTPIHERFKDYIATPKSNMYQSLHTTVVVPGGVMVEFQIRTGEMHETAELGVAAHYLYKEGGGGPDPELLAKLQPVLRNAEWQSMTSDPDEFMEFLKTSLYQDEVFVFTPRGDLKRLPRGATPLDFAYLVHTQVGHRCVGAKANGRIIPLRYELRSGDTVQIITSPIGKPHRDWLKIVKSPNARSKIRHWLKTSEHADSLALGREMLERELRRRRLSPPENTPVDELAKTLGYGDADQLYEAIGRGSISVAQAIQRWFPQGVGPVQRIKEASLDTLRAITRRPGRGVRIQGVDNLMINYAKCCQPVPGDSVVGIVTRGRGVTVHRTDCPNTFEDRVASERRLLVDWDAVEGDSFVVKLSIYGMDRKSLLADIAKAISATNTNIRTAGIKARDRNAQGAFAVEVRDLNHLREVMRAVERVKGVESVEREQVFGNPPRSGENENRA